MKFQVIWIEKFSEQILKNIEVDGHYHCEFNGNKSKTKEGYAQSIMLPLVLNYCFAISREIFVIELFNQIN